MTLREVQDPLLLVPPHQRQQIALDCAKDTELRRLPSREFAINAAWCTLAEIAADLIAWLQILALSGDLARYEPKTLRYRVLHTAARLVHGQRRCPVQRAGGPRRGP
jgi:hypothetical protein